jgi:hypothetical protein
MAMRDCGVGDFTDTSLSGEVSPVVVGPSGSHRRKSVRSKDVEFGPHLVQDLFVALLAQAVITGANAAGTTLRRRRMWMAEPANEWIATLVPGTRPPLRRW